MPVFDADLRPAEYTMSLSDGTELFYRAWHPPAPTNKAVIFFHRGHEHSGRLSDVVEEMELQDAAIFAWDARGHGRSGGTRGYAPSFSCLTKDVDSFVRHISLTHDVPVENMVIVAHSVGGVIATTWIHDYAPKVRGLVLLTPALRVKLYIPFAIPALRLLRKVRGERPAFVQSYVKSRMLTHDHEQAKRYDADPLITRDIAVDVLLGMYDASTRLLADAGAIRVPTLILSAGSDWVVWLGAQRKFFERLGSRNKMMRVFQGMYHDMLHENGRGEVLAEIRRFVTRAFRTDAPLAGPPPLLDADQQGFTHDEYIRLSRPLPVGSMRWLYFTATAKALQTVGRLSRGIDLGYQTGFDSGRMLDYVYENRARGALGIGTLIDRIYLETPGWRGIRTRRAQLESVLGRAVSGLAHSRREVRLLDIAAGPGRYMLETLRKWRQHEVSAVLRDNVPDNLTCGRQLAARMNLHNVTFEHGDAFNAESIAAATPAPNVAVVSGLYELFPDNERIRTSLAGLAQALAGGGYLIYTNQPWHPQVELIARVLTNRLGRPWIMRRRTQEEMDGLVRAAGFEKLDMEIDEQGIFTVSLARIGDVPDFHSRGLI